jgi:phosphate transport system permease protein
MLAIPAAPLSPVSVRSRRSVKSGDVLFGVLCQLAGYVVVGLAAALVAVLVWKSWLGITTNGLSFLTTSVWDPEPSHRHFGALAFIYGTVSTSTIAMVIAVPFGVGSALFLSECAPGWVQRIGSSLVEMLAAVPSIVYGFWGLFVLAPALQKIISMLGGPSQGSVGILPAGMVLSIMIVPYIASISYDVLRAVPRSQRDASFALGATRWQTIRLVLLPYATPGIVGGCFIALGRALGETMAVTMLIGNRPEIKLSLFAMGNSIASVIANEFTEATYDLYLSALVELGLVLMVVSIAMNALARLLIWRVSKGQSQPLLGSLRKLRPATKLPPVPEDFVIPGIHPGTQKRAIKVNRLMIGMLCACLVLTITPLFLILGYLLYQGIGSLDWNFFTQLPAPVGETGGGMANACLGSLLLVGLATLFALPVGLFTAIYLAEYRTGRLGSAIRFTGEMLGSVPSIVIGIFAYAIIVKPMGHFSGWAGGFALGVMMIPIFMRAAEGALRLVPIGLRQASDALGASRWQTVMRVVLPAALPALITALFLSVARIAGETAPLLLTASSNQFWPTSPNDFMPSLPVYIFNYAVSPYEDWHRQAWAAALVLLVAVMLLNFGVRYLSSKRQVSGSGD